MRLFQKVGLLLGFGLLPFCTHAAGSIQFAEELYQKCKYHQAIMKNENTQKLSPMDLVDAGQCLGYVTAYPMAYIVGGMSATQGKFRQAPGCYDIEETTANQVIVALIRRYEKSPKKFRGQIPDVLMMLVLREELCA